MNSDIENTPLKDNFTEKRLFTTENYLELDKYTANFFSHWQSYIAERNIFFAEFQKKRSNSEFNREKKIAKFKVEFHRTINRAKKQMKQELAILDEKKSELQQKHDNIWGPAYNEYVCSKEQINSLNDPNNDCLTSRNDIIRFSVEEEIYLEKRKLLTTYNQIRTESAKKFNSEYIAERNRLNDKIKAARSKYYASKKIAKIEYDEKVENVKRDCLHKTYELENEYFLQRYNAFDKYRKQVIEIIKIS